jgi:hypothetical protein
MPESLDELIEQAAGRAYLKKLKTAGPMLDTAKQFIRKSRVNLIAGGTAALLSGILTRQLAKPGKNGEPSFYQRKARGLAASVAAEEKERKRVGGEPPFLKGVSQAAAPGLSSISDFMAKHPNTAGAIAGAAAAKTGPRLLNLAAAAFEALSHKK